MRRRPPGVTRTDTSFPTRRSSELWGAVDVALDDEGRVAALGQEVKACALGQASAALMGAGVLGREPAELVEARDALSQYLAGARDEPGDWPGLEVFSEARAYKRSEEHTSELQSLMRISYAVFCLKKKRIEQCDRKC